MFKKLKELLAAPRPKWLLSLLGGFFWIGVYVTTLEPVPSPREKGEPPDVRLRVEGCSISSEGGIVTARGRLVNPSPEDLSGVAAVLIVESADGGAKEVPYVVGGGKLASHSTGEFHLRALAVPRMTSARITVSYLRGAEIRFTGDCPFTHSTLPTVDGSPVDTL